MGVYDGSCAVTRTNIEAGERTLVVWVPKGGRAWQGSGTYSFLHGISQAVHLAGTMTMTEAELHAGRSHQQTVEEKVAMADRPIPKDGLDRTLIRHLTEEPWWRAHVGEYNDVGWVKGVEDQGSLSSQLPTKKQCEYYFLASADAVEALIGRSIANPVKVTDLYLLAMKAHAARIELFSPYTPVGPQGVNLASLSVMEQVLELQRARVARQRAACLVEA